MELKELLRDLCQLDGVPGYEDEVRAYIEEKARPYADEMFADSVGNLFVLKKGKVSPKRPLMVCAHMDEVGFLVRNITEDGMVKLAPAGGIDPRVLIGRRMKVGLKKTLGVISIKAIHLTTPEERLKAPDLQSLYVDMGATSKKEAEKYAGVGEPIMFDSDFVEFGDNCIKAKALDDRIGCAVMLDMLKGEVPQDTWFVFAVGEEIGHRGARVAVQRLDPAAVLVIEGTTAADMPDVPAHKQSTRIRQGAVVSLIDGGNVYSRGLRQAVCAEADKRGVKWQYRQSANGATDASFGTIGASGALTFGLSAPVRYIHCACGVAYLPDLAEIRAMADIVLEKAGEQNV